MAGSMQPDALRSALTDGGEFALLDVRERGEYARGHLFLAINLPLSHLELRLRRYVPRRTVRVIICDDGSGLSERAGRVLESAGYTDVFVIVGGAPACAAAGMEMYRAHYAVTYAFGLYVDRHYRPPAITPQSLQAKRASGEELVVLDARPIWDFHDASIPWAIDVPLAELPYRIRDVAPDPKTQVIITCGAVARGVLGGRTLIEAGVENPVAVLTNGVRGWELAGYESQHGVRRSAGPSSREAIDWAHAAAQHVKNHYGVTFIAGQTLQRWRADDTRTLYVIDVRTREEYEAGHLHDAIWVLGGELIGLYEDHIGTWNARVCLVDDDTSRAIVTASWLLRMGWPDVVVLEGGIHEHELVTGPEVQDVPELDNAHHIPRIDAQALANRIAKDATLVLDVAASSQYESGHVPGAWWTIRARLPALIHKLPAAQQYIVTSEEGRLALLTALDLRQLTATPVAVLAGGTNAWREGGFALVNGMTRALGEIDDNLAELNVRAGDDRTTALAARRRMLKWQEELLDKLERDDTFSFPPLP
ncbi:MAG: rhodanese-like domain-containing protein [Gammaproteobacteria bacterium]|nr:rhodanese-like domain-containing protein [Gammaproteobacteria bacterium]